MRGKFEKVPNAIQLGLGTGLSRQRSILKVCSIYHGFGLGLGIEGIASGGVGSEDPGCLDVAIVECIPNIQCTRAISTSLKDPSAALTPNGAVCSSMAAFGTLHHLRRCSVPRAPSLVSRTTDTVPARRGVGDRITMRCAARIRTSQPRKGIISSSFLSESVVQSELQPVGLVYGVSLRHALDNLLDKFGCFVCPQFGVQMLPAHLHDFGVPGREL